MGKYLEDVPSDWKEKLALTAIPKDGAAYNDSFSVHADLPINYWGQIYTLESDILTDISACRTEGRVVMTLSLSARVSAPCSRCLETAHKDIAGEFRYILSLDRDETAEDTAKDASCGDDDIVVLDSWEDDVDLGPIVWESLISLLPSAMLCRDDCKGLCPQCGENLNKKRCGCKVGVRDPRFDVLKNLMEENDK
ncbi:MAG: DUF177 domain-containing protein [Synergistes sp.]|nr:DUF177 domain-containing protein [Synergistes sp.]